MLLNVRKPQLLRVKTGYIAGTLSSKICKNTEARCTGYSYNSSIKGKGKTAMFAISIESIAQLQSGAIAEIVSGGFLYKIEDDLLIALPYDEDAEIDAQFEAMQELAFQ